MQNAKYSLFIHAIIIITIVVGCVILHTFNIIIVLSSFWKGTSKIIYYLVFIMHIKLNFCQSKMFTVRMFVNYKASKWRTEEGLRKSLILKGHK